METTDGVSLPLDESPVTALFGKASQPFAVIHNHPGNAASDSRNLLQFGGICGVETDDSSREIFHKGVPLYAWCG